MQKVRVIVKYKHTTSEKRCRAKFWITKPRFITLINDDKWEQGFLSICTNNNPMFYKILWIDCYDYQNKHPYLFCSECIPYMNRFSFE